LREQVMLARHTVAADNNCLFTSAAYLCKGLTSAADLRAAARELRTVCANTVLADEEPETRAVLLGHDSVQAYSDWIVNETHWGGEPELLMLAEHFGVEIVLASCETLRVTRYAASSASDEVYLLYTGQHYDPLVGPSPDDLRRFPTAEAAEGVGAARCAAALEIASQHNEEAARRAARRFVKRLKCSGCGAILDDSAAFQEHCGVVEHDDDFTYDCEEVELVLEGDEALPATSIDLNAENVAAFYNAAQPTLLTLSMACTLAPFDFDGTRYASVEEFWRSPTISDLSLAERRPKLKQAIRSQYATSAAKEAGLRDLLLETGDKLIACVDIDCWIGVQAAGGISTGSNLLGEALMEVREELRSGTLLSPWG